MKKTNKKQIPKVRMPKYSTGGKTFGKGLKDTGLFLADTALAEWAPNAISQDQYSDSPYGKNLGKVASIHESFDSQSPIRKNVSKYWTDNKSSGMNEEEQSLFNSVQPIAKTGSKIGEMWTGSALGGIGAGAGSKATGFGKNLGKVSEMGTKDYNPNVYNENQVQNQAQIESQNQTAMSGLNDARRNSMTPNGNMYAKYGGQMKFAMGGMNMQPNAEIELTEGTNSNGRIREHDLNSHKNATAENQKFLEGGTKILSTKLIDKTTGKPYSNATVDTKKWEKIINNPNSTPISKTSAKININTAGVLFDQSFARQEAQKKQMASSAFDRIVKKYGVPPQLKNLQPSMDNEQTEPQGMSEQSEGEAPMARYDGRFAMGGMQPYAIGGMTDEDPPVYEPLSKTDSLKITNLINKNPRYDLKNYNFDVKRIYNKKGEEIDADIYRTDLKTGKQTLESDAWKTDNTKHSTLQEIISRQNISQNKPLNAKPQFYDTYKNSLDYLNQKHAMGGVQLPYYNIDRNGNPKYGMGGFNDEEPLTSATTSTVAPTLGKIPTDFKTQNAFDTYMKSNVDYAPNPQTLGKNTTYYPKKKYSYNKDTNIWSNTDGTPVEFNSPPSSDLIGFTPKNTATSTSTANWQTNQQLRGGGNKLTFPGGATQIVAPKKYGGMMPKYAPGGWVPKSNLNYSDEPSLGYVPQTQFEANKMYAMEENRANPKFNPSNSRVNPYDNIDAADRKAEREAREAAEMNGTGSDAPPMNNIDWNKTDKLGNLVNFIGQNAGNIYDLTRKNAPLQSYERTTGKYITPDFRDANQKYLWAKKALANVSGGNAGTTLANIQQAHVDNVMNRAQIQQAADNTNAQIGNQVNQFNTEIAYREAEARAKDAAMKQNVRSQAIASIGSSFGKATKSGKQDNIDQDTLKMFQWRYKNEPGFKKYIDNFSTENNSEEAVV